MNDLILTFKLLGGLFNTVNEYSCYDYNLTFVLNLQAMDMHSQPLELDFNCMSSTPNMDFTKNGSPKSGMEPIYGNKSICDPCENGEDLLGTLNSSSDIFSNGLGSDRLSGDYDINSVLPPPKSRELAIGESYSDIGKNAFTSM